jgi:SAM-dependent methyltransferase
LTAAVTCDVKGTAGYAEEAPELLVRYESFGFEEAHEAVLDLLPAHAGDVLDVGAGTGRDVAHLAAKGNRAVAAEPTAALREAAAELHPSAAIEWVDDGLPALKTVVGRGTRFDLILMSAVWMHLDEQERSRAMPVIASLLAPGGTVVMTLRHGPVPTGRRMFAVTGTETVTLAETSGLETIRNRHAESQRAENRRASVSWTTLVFRAPSPSDQLLRSGGFGVAVVTGDR